MQSHQSRCNQHPQPAARDAAWHSQKLSKPAAGTRSRKRFLLDELKVCKDLQRGREIHAEATETGFGSCIYFSTALVRMYSKCRSMPDALQVFQSIKHPDVVSWTALIMGYADNGDGNIALDLFQRMKRQGCSPDSFTFVAVLKAYTSLALDQSETGRLKYLERGKELHLQIGRHSTMHVQNTLICMYSKCRSTTEARKVFDSIKHPDVVSWTNVISGYAENGEGVMALNMFARMKSRGCSADCFTYVAALKACTSIALDQSKAAGLERGKEIHAEIGCHLDLKLQNTLVDMYAKCGSMVTAHRVFHSIKHPDVVSWNALILGYVDNGEGTTALNLLAEMRAEGCAPNSFTIVAAVKACASLAENRSASDRAELLERAREISSRIGPLSDSDTFVQSAMMNMYAKCGSMPEARRIFESMKHPDVVSWTALILGYADNGEAVTALELFGKMKSEGCSPDSFTYISVLGACALLALVDNGSRRAEWLSRGKAIHAEIGCRLDMKLQNSLIDMYAKCGSMTDARQVFDGIKQPDVVSWTTLILGYADNGEGVTALNLFSRMRTQGCAPSSLTFVAAFKACGFLGALECGSRIHAEIAAEPDSIVVTALVDFYAKCGSLAAAESAFESYPKTRDLTAWNAMLAGYCRSGDGEAVFRTLERMRESGFQPNGVTLLCVLTCCSQAGLVEKATELFEAMPRRYGVTPSLEHYNVMVDILGRSNKLDEAVALVDSMPCRPNAISWMTLLGACHKWKNVEIGRLAFRKSMEFAHTKASAYVLMANIYGSRGMRKEQQEMVLAMRDDGMGNAALGQACWTNEAGDEVHAF